MKVLVFCGDEWHPSEIVREGLAPLEGNEFSFDWITDVRDWTPEVIMAYPVVILTKSDNVSENDQTSWMTQETQATFSRYLSQGNGLLAIHSGTAGYEQKTMLRGILGGVFLSHPEQCPVTVNPMSHHPLCSGIPAFTLQDEHYFMALDDLNADIFMTTNSENGEQPGGWKRVAGDGRVIVLTPGHNLVVWLHPSYQALMLNSLLWCGKLL